MAMSDNSLTDRLRRLTPAPGPDRDALLFAAGRASARPARRWQALTAVLAATQLVTLGLLLWPRPVLPTPGGPPVLVDAPFPFEPSPQPLPPTASEVPHLLILRDRALATDGNLPPAAPVDSLAPPQPPLRTSAHRRQTC